MARLQWGEAQGNLFSFLTVLFSSNPQGFNWANGCFLMRMSQKVTDNNLLDRSGGICHVAMPKKRIG